MTDTIDPRTLPEFDAARYLTNAEEIATYLGIVAEENDPAALAQALGAVARARGMTAIAEASGLQRESLYKALGAGASQPQFDTIRRVCAALGVAVTFTALPLPKAVKASTRKAPVAKGMTTRGKTRSSMQTKRSRKLATTA